MTNKHTGRFNIAAPEYNTDKYPGRAQCVRKVLELLEPRIEDVILDVGCGPGTQLINLSRLIKSGYGIDPAEQMIRQAEESATNCPNLQFYVGSAEVFPKEVHHIGINKIISNYALHHLPDNAKRQSIRNWASLLPENGMIVLGDLMFSDNPDRYKALFDVVGYGPGCDTPSQLSLLEDMFIEAGLSPWTHILNPLVAVIVGRKT
jgi:SAM-dependent methyltransferase